MNEWIFAAMAFGAVLGGLDHIFGNRFGLGRPFQEAFQLLGSIGLSMAGILCLAPVLSNLVKTVATPLFGFLGFDPGILGGILAIDMGGYQMAMDLAEDAALGRFAGIVLAATFGCTLVFTIPVGMGAMEDSDRPEFTKGLLVGLAAMPVSLLLSGMMAGISLRALLWNCLPIFLLSLLLLVGLVKAPEAMARWFRRFSGFIQKVSIFGLTLGAVQYMTGWALLPGLIPLAEAMEVVCSIAIVMLGSMPLAVLIQKLLKGPLLWIQKKTGLNQTSTTALLIGSVSVVPALAMFPKMDRRGKVMNGAFLVCGASAFAAHLGFTLTVEPEMTSPLLLCKLLGGALGAAMALIVTPRQDE